MSSNTQIVLYRWRIYCETDSRFEFVWLPESASVPTTCPTDTAHMITSALTRIIETRDPTCVNVKQQGSIGVGNHFLWDSIAFTAVANTTTTHTFSYPIPVTVLSAEWQTAAENTGDIVSWTILKDTVVGALTADIGVGETTLSVSSTVIENINIGYDISITDGTNTDILDLCTSIDAENNTITVETATQHAFLAATPTVVRFGVPFLKNVEIGHPMRMQIGESKIEGSDVPANTLITCEYTNNSPTDDKRICCYIEMLY